MYYIDEIVGLFYNCIGTSKVGDYNIASFLTKSSSGARWSNRKRVVIGAYVSPIQYRVRYVIPLFNGNS